MTTKQHPTDAMEMPEHKYELTHSIIHKCLALKLPQSFIMKLGMTAQIVPLPGLTQEQAEALLADLNSSRAERIKAYDMALEEVAKKCDDADKSTHPAELADAIRSMKHEQQ